MAGACEKYRELASEITAEMIVYLAWFGNQNPEILTEEAAAKERLATLI